MCLYDSVDDKAVLKLLETQTLVTEERLAPGKGSMMFKASLGPECKPCQKLQRWHEVSISSIKLKEILVQNPKLTIGEEASWTIEDISKLGVAEAIYGPAVEMLRKIDGIGQRNNNGLERPGNMSGGVSRMPAPMKKKEEFW